VNRPVLALLLLPMTAWSADDMRISFLEQEVRNLQRQVQALSQQMNDLQRRPDRPPVTSSLPDRSAPSPGSDAWIDAGKWRRVHAGMGEMEVIGLLGAPTSIRDEGDARVLLYAMEIGSTAFLGGSVTLRNRLVAEVKPTTLQ